MTEAPKRNWFVRLMDSRATTRAIQMVAVLSLVMSMGLWAKQYSLAECLADYNDQQARASGKRLDAAEEDRKALDLMINSFVTAKKRGDAAEALKNYVQTRSESDAKRAKNPPPAPPSEVCH